MCIQSICVSIFLLTTGLVHAHGFIREYDRIQGALPNEIHNNSPRHLIIVDSQAAFEEICSKITNCLKQGHNNIVVSFEEGVYYYKNDCIKLSGIKADNASISLIGNGAILISHGRKYVFNQTNKSRYYGVPSVNNTYLTDYLSEIDLFGQMHQLDTLVEVVDGKKKMCRIKSDYYNADLYGLYIQVSKWFYTALCRVVDIKDGYIYFIDESLEYSEEKGHYSINEDYRFGKRFPRYRLFNDKQTAPVSISKDQISCSLEGLSAVYECLNGRYISIENSSFLSLIIRGFTFVGNRDIEGGLIQLASVKCQQVGIQENSFKFIKSPIISASNVDNLVFSDNCVTRCARDCVVANNMCSKTIVCGNVFIDNGSRYIQHHCVKCTGKDFHIYDNFFCDFSYCAIRVGEHYRNPYTQPCKGIVEHNEICYSKEYLDNLWQHTFMDSGAIYIDARNESTIIRYNYIHDYGGMYLNRGIFCDNGANNFVIYGNVINGIKDSYTIDSWLFTGRDGDSIPCNSNNIIYGNILGGDYRFQGAKNGDCQYGRNWIIKDNSSTVVMSTMNLTCVENDLSIENAQYIKNRIILPRSVRRHIRKSGVYKSIKRYIQLR